MDKRNDYYNDWDDQFYGTGPTEPPKSRGGLVALMLILIIFLSGIITVLGVLNIKLFHQLQTRQENELSISFTTESTVPEDAPISMASEPAQYSDAPFVSMDLQQAPAGVENVPAQGGLSLQDIYTRNIDSVVSITCSKRSSTSSGTGVILSQDGYIVTNAHVVEGGSSITVQLTDDRTFSASIVGSDEISDLAVLYIAAEGLTPAQFGDSSSLRVGDTVVAIGDPLGVEFRGTYTNGIVSAINRDVDVDGRTMTLIQTNAALNSGNSGGPLINCYGQVIGINTMKIGTYTDSAGVEGLGFAIPSATVKDVVDQLITQGYVSGRPTLGIEGEALSTFYQHYYRMPAGLYITAVERSSDAYTKGIEDGDILISVNGTRVISMDDLKAVLYECEVGQTVQTVIYRAGQQYQVELTLAEDKG
ncbi:MAG: trypsin-like peptidase domain-containing protein [Oscillospiraceae bacterium]|nr:trypsin-like peptidase domain-containing protein [Oscillospiraceae bacterium]